MSDQLSLRLSGDVARLPRTLHPMLPKPAHEPFDSPDHVFEPGWGGRRVVAFVEDGRTGRRPRLRLVDETGRDLAPHLPELHALPDQISGLPAILDGELVVPDRTGHMDEAALSGRLADGQTTGLAPVFLAFDLLWSAGRPILAQPLLRRREMLARAVMPSAEVVVVPGVVADGRALYEAVVEQGLAGVRARHLRSPYIPGRRSELWLWVAAQPGIRLRALPDPVPASARPLLALIQRLPLEDEG